MLIVGYSRAASAAPPAELGVGTLIAYADDELDATKQFPLPAGIESGSTLVVGISTTLSRALTTAPAGWVLVDSDMTTSGLHIYAKTADGSEGGTSIDWIFEASVRAVFVFAEIRGTSGAVEATFASASLDPPSHAPAGGSAETAWIALSSGTRTTNSVDAAPAGYAGFAWAQCHPGSTSNNHVTAGGAYRISTAASEDPGAFAWSGTVGNPQAATISVR